MKRFEEGNRWCEVGSIRQVFFDGMPCYEVSGRGDLNYYLGGNDPLYIEETPTGWTVGYRPADDDFVGYAQGMVDAGAWG